MVRIYFKIFLICAFCCYCGYSSANEWEDYENSFKNNNREEIYIKKIEAFYQTNFTASNWKSLNTGNISFNIGILNRSSIAILIVKKIGRLPNITCRIIDLNTSISDVNIYHKRKNGKDINLIVAYSNKEKHELIWYTLESDTLIRVWTWLLDKTLSYYYFGKIENRDALFSVSTNLMNISSVDIYEFSVKPFNRWFYQSIHLDEPAYSLSINNIESYTYLSIPQKSLGHVVVYQLLKNHFVRFKNLTSFQVDQVISFENGFKSFVAFNGLNSSIYQFRNFELVREEVKNSNMKNIQFWIPIPIQTYRDETLLLAQRKIDHESHSALEVDVITYNGNRFEEHEDIPCNVFNESYYGLNCLTESNPTTGLIGSGYITLLDYLGLVVPNINNASLILNFEVNIRKVDHPKRESMDNLIRLKEKLEIIISEQKQEFETIINQYQSLGERASEISQTTFGDSPNLTSSLKRPVNDTLDNLKQKIETLAKEVDAIRNGNPFKLLREKFDTIIFNNAVTMQGELSSNSVNTVSIGNKDADQLLKNIARKDLTQNIAGEKTFSNLMVNNINFRNVNGITGSNFLVNSSNKLQIDGDLIFEKPSQVSEIVLTSSFINDIEINREWVDVYNIQGSLNIEILKCNHNFSTKLLNKFDTTLISSTELFSSSLFKDIEYNNLYISGNVTVENINGEPFHTFLKQLCFTPFKCHIPDLLISGVLNVSGDAIADYLNDLKYPDDYVGINSAEDILVISGIKQFSNITRGYKVFTDSFVNNIDLKEIVTLNTDQEILGDIIFNYLEVISDLSVKGKIIGDEIEKFIPNLDLQDSRHIFANVMFDHLLVEGNIIVENAYNNTKIDSIFQNFIYQYETAATITGNKNFTQGFSVRQDLKIDSNSINNLTIDTFITKDTDQRLDITSLVDIVDFDHLTVTGLFNGENITELNKTIVKMNESHNISSKWVFLKPVVLRNITFDNLDDIKWDSPESESTNIFDENKINDDIETEVLVIEGNFTGSIHNFDLDQFSRSYLHYIKEQDIYAQYSIDTLSVENIDINMINDFEFRARLSYKMLRNNISNSLAFSNNAKIENLHLHGPLHINFMNTHNFNKSLTSNMWVKLHRSNPNITNLIVTGDVHFNSLHLLALATVIFDNYVDNLVFKNDTDVKFRDALIFKNGITVKKILETDNINDVELNNVLRIDARQDLVNRISIIGDIAIKDDLKVDILNNVDVENVFKNVNVTQSAFIMTGDVIFQRLAYVTDMILNGTINDINMEDLLHSFVYIDNDVTLTKNTIFKNSVNIDGNLAINNDINGVMLSNFASKIVLTTKDSIIEGPIRFLFPVGLLRTFNIYGKLETNKLYGQNLRDCLNHAIFVNKGRLTGTYTFKNVSINEQLNTKFINGIGMDNVIPLKSSQVIERLLIDGITVANNVTVGNKVNGIDLMIEKSRTVLANVEQDIPSDIVFLNNILIEEQLITPLINNQSTSKIVFTNTDQILTGVYNFNAKDWTAGNFNIHGLINGIDIVQWKKISIPWNSSEMETVEDEWTIIENLNVVDDLEGNGTINGINIKQLINDLSLKESKTCDLKKGILDDYNSICVDVSYIHEKAKHQIYKFKYFKEYQKIFLNQNIKYVKPFKHQDKDYLLIQEENSCYTYLYVFLNPGFHKIESIDSGSIGQAEVIKNNNELFFITRTDEKQNIVCKIRLISALWKFSNENFELLESLEEQEVLHASEIPLTFYGLRHGTVTEFKVDVDSLKHIRPYRKWNIESENADFFPRGFKTGLAMRNGQILQYLIRNDPVIENGFGIDSEAYIVGTVSQTWNPVVPGRTGGDIAVLKVGINNTLKTMLAVSNYKIAKVHHRLDLVEVYSNPFEKELYDKIPTYKPSWLTSIEFNNGETLLAFLEDNKILQIYEYKGVEGFKLRSSIKIQASELFVIDLPIENKWNSRKVLGVVYKDVITLLEAVMVGNKINSDLKCNAEL